MQVDDFFLFLMTIHFVIVKAKHGCKEFDYLPCIKNKTLTGHVIKSFKVMAPGLKMCQRKCFTEGQCVSYNLGPVDGQIRTCELSAADHWMRPKFLIFKEGFEYCPIRNPCSSNPCPSNRLCTPDFSLDTFSCDDGGWTQWSSWNRCIVSCSTRQTRMRSCSKPAPQNRGSQCFGEAQQTKACQPSPKIEVKNIGCFKDYHADRTLHQVLIGEIKPHTICSCALLAQPSGYGIFGIQNNGGACRTDPSGRITYNKHGNATNCLNGLGGSLSNNVYEFKEIP